MKLQVSDTGKWDILEVLQKEINELETLKREMYQDRSRMIMDRAVGIDSTDQFVTSGVETFIKTMEATKERLYVLWAEKRRELSTLQNSYPWSWIGPIIRVSNRR